VVFELNWQITFENKYHNYIIFHLQHNTFPINVVNLINCWFLLAYQITIHNKYSKCPPPESMCAWTHLSWVNLLLGCTSKTICRHILVWSSFLVLVCGTHFWSLPKHFRYTLCIAEILCWTGNSYLSLYSVKHSFH